MEISRDDNVGIYWTLLRNSLSMMFTYSCLPLEIGNFAQMDCRRITKFRHHLLSDLLGGPAPNWTGFHCIPFGTRTWLGNPIVNALQWKHHLEIGDFPARFDRRVLSQRFEEHQHLTVELPIEWPIADSIPWYFQLSDETRLSLRSLMQCKDVPRIVSACPLSWSDWSQCVHWHPANSALAQNTIPLAKFHTNDS